MKFFAAIAALAAVASAHYSAAPIAEESCASIVTVTVTSLLPMNTPSAPATHVVVTGPAPYPTTAVGMPPVVGTGYPSKPSKPVEGAAHPSGTAAPSGTGAYSAPPTQFTGAAANIKVGGALAAGAFAALFL
ncbi:hypothetical protein DE146DRAFT_678171 [Phaeosphaeria sp. MPI-PUGE-AT-0046c]|nr:hypothetical protein DE146DRAFT_678171 [Phaeosphaeria sp. MPI-PUGE-AT-0046c]